MILLIGWSISTYFLKSRNDNDWKILVFVLKRGFANNINPLLSKGIKKIKILNYFDPTANIPKDGNYDQLKMEWNEWNFFHCTVKFLCVTNSASDCFIYQHHYQTTIINYGLCQFLFGTELLTLPESQQKLDNSKRTPKSQDTLSPTVSWLLSIGAGQSSHCYFRAQIKAVGSKLCYIWHWKLMNQCHHSLRHVEFIHICHVIYSVLNEICGGSCTVLIIKTNYGNHSMHNAESS